MREEIENPKRSQIEEYLAEIGWSLRHHGCEHYYFYNHKKKCVGMYLVFPETDGRLESQDKSWETPKFVFYLKEIRMTLLGNDGVYDCVSFQAIHDKSIFILCPNYDKKTQNTQVGALGGHCRKIGGVI